VFADRPLAFGLNELSREFKGNAPGYVVLDFQQIRSLSVEPFGPEMRSGFGVYELCINPNLVSGATDAPFQDVSHTNSRPICFASIALSL